MSFQEKVKLDFLFVIRDFKSIIHYVQKHKLVEELSAFQAGLIARHIDLDCNKELMYSLMGVASKADRKELIRRLYFDSVFVSYRKEFELYFKDFLEVGMELENDSLLYHLALIANNNKELEQEKKSLEEYFLKRNVSFVTIAVAALYGFNQKKFQEKIISSHNGVLMGDYLATLDLAQVNVFLSDYLSSKVGVQEIKDIMESINDNDNLVVKLIHSILKVVNDSKVKSQFLLEILKADHFLDHRDYLISHILLLNDTLVLQELMGYLSSQEQSKYAKEAMEANINDLIFNLAWMTDSDMTSALIHDVIYREDVAKVTYLLASLNSKYLSYAFHTILSLNKDGKYYEDIIKGLFKLASPTYINLISFIKESDKYDIFDKAMQSYFEGLVELAEENNSCKFNCRLDV